MAVKGSSPLTRGKQGHLHASAGQARLIPAHAGKTTRPTRRPCRREAHPRSRGENHLVPGTTFRYHGSSPLTRGKPPQDSGLACPLRLIPAHAGKTRLATLPLVLREAHPRSRGENFALDSRRRTQLGSSPLTRGKHFLTCAFTAQIDQILETLELAVSSGSYSIWVACTTDAPQDQVRSIGLVLPSSRGAS